MKNKFLFYPILTIFLVLILDQWLKIYIKLNFRLTDEINIFGDWFKIHFTENYGMAFGIEFGGKVGKVILTLFRIIFVGIIAYYVSTLIKNKRNIGYTLSWSLIMAGALGNIIDSVFYGKLFSESTPFGDIAQLLPTDGGYNTWFQGKVVDMLYFPIIHTNIPNNFPFWAGEDFEFFRPVFNISDSAISIGFVLFILFQKRFAMEEQQLNESTKPEANVEN